MSDQTLAIIIFGALCVFALVMFLLERRAVAQRKANGTYTDISDIVFMGVEQAKKREAAQRGE